MEQFKILIVDDEATNIEVLTGLLKSRFRLMIAKSGAQALKAVTMDDPPDLILLDIMMPELDGFETCRQLKSDPETADIPVIFITAKAETDDILKGFEIGAVDYINKPFNPKELLARVNSQAQLKLASLDLQASEERFRSIIELANDAIIVTDRDLTVEMWNKSASRLFGYEESEVIGQRLSKLFDANSKATFENSLVNSDQLDKTDSGLILDLTATTKNGRDFPIELSAGIWESGEKTHISAIIRDLTERKNMENQVAQSEKMAGLGTLVAGIAHEINNPVNFVHMNVHNLKDNLRKHHDFLFELLEEEVEIINHLTEEFGKFDGKISDIIEGSERIKSIVNDLRNFSRDEGEEKQVMELSKNLESTSRLVKAKYKKEVKFISKIKNDLRLECWPSRLNQVFMNIMVNACQAIVEKQTETGDPTPGKVTIQAFDTVTEIGIRIEDTGIGMSEDVKKKMIEPFFTTKPVGEGTGMGMAITYGIIERHNGRLEVESVPGEGTSITVYLPRTP